MPSFFTIIPNLNRLQCLKFKFPEILTSLHFVGIACARAKDEELGIPFQNTTFGEFENFRTKNLQTLAKKLDLKSYNFIKYKLSYVSSIKAQFLSSWGQSGASLTGGLIARND